MRYLLLLALLTGCSADRLVSPHVATYAGDPCWIIVAKFPLQGHPNDTLTVWGHLAGCSH